MLKLVAGVLGFPFLAIIALLHGILSIVFGILSAIKNHFRGILSFIFAPFYIARKSVGGSEETVATVYSFTVGWSFFVPSCIYAVLTHSYKFNVKSVLAGSFEMNAVHYVAAGSAFILVCGALSLLYEIGRWYWKSVLKKGTSEVVAAKPEAVEAPKADDPNDIFEELLSELNMLVESGFTAEAIAQFVQKLTEIFKKDKLTTDQYLHLMQLVKNAKKNPVVPVES